MNNIDPLKLEHTVNKPNNPDILNTGINEYFRKRYKNLKAEAPRSP